MSSAGSVLRTVFVFSFVFIVMWAIAVVLGIFLSAWSIGWFIAFSAIALLMNLFTYFASDKLVLWSYRVRIVEPAQEPRLHRMIEEIAREAGIPKPRIGIFKESSPNAFATGRNPKHAVVAFTTGILSLMSEEELKGVAAHEISHVKNRDTLIMTAVATVAAFFAYAVQFGGRAAAARQRNAANAIAIIILSYIGGLIAAMLIRAFVSRRREYKADATGAKIVGDSRGLSSALLKLDYATRKIPMKTAREASAHLFIANPWGKAAGIFMSHPPIEKRVERLRQMER